MTRATGTQMWYSNNITVYKGTWVPLSDSLKTLAPSLVQTSDTGQVNWATTTTVPAANAVRDYEVYRFGDVLQATKPIYIRLDYLVPTTTSARLRVTVGTATDGAGNLSGVTAGPFEMGSTGGSQSANLTYWVASNGSYLTIAAGIAATGTGSQPYHQVVVVERYRGTDGVANGEGYFVAAWTNGTWAGWAPRYTNGNSGPTGATIELHPAVLIPQMAAGTAFVGDTVYAYPLHGYAPTLQGGSAAVMWAFMNDLPRCAEVVMPVYSEPTARWLSLGSAVTSRTPYLQTVTGAYYLDMSIVVRYD